MRETDRPSGMIPPRRGGTVPRMPALDVLDHTVTTDRTLVHRWSVAEVFLTDLACDGPQRVRAAAQWPRQHAYFDTQDGTYCLLLGAETFRQVTIAALHDTGLAAPDDVFVMQRMAVAWARAVPRTGPRPLDLWVTLAMTPAGRAGRFDLEVTVADADGPLVTGTGVVVVLRPEVYATLRRGRTGPVERVDPTATTPCHAVGRTRGRDVVLAGARTGPWSLRVDTGHPTFFDHPSDHVPGMLLFEAARQAALLASPGAHVVSLAADFASYLELDAPVDVAVEPDAAGHTVTVRQAGTVGARFVVGVRG